MDPRGCPLQPGASGGTKAGMLECSRGCKREASGQKGSEGHWCQATPWEACATDTAENPPQESGSPCEAAAAPGFRLDDCEEQPGATDE